MEDRTKNRMVRALQLFVLLMIFGVTGYLYLGGPTWSILDATYMTVITLGTVGYGETHDLSQNPWLRVHTMVLILLGIGTMTYAFSTLTMAIVEGELNQILKRQRMSQGISQLNGHVIVCGAGRTGIHVIEELRSTLRPFVVIEKSRERLDKHLERFDFLHIIGDATDDQVLVKARVAQATGLVACLPDDRDNIFITISARHLGPKLRIVAKAELETRHKLVLAGADAAVAPHLIGGLRLASEMIRPDVVNFLDRMMRSAQGTVRIDEVAIKHGAPIDGTTLLESKVRERTGVNVLAMRVPDQENFIYNPLPTQVMAAGTVLVVLGEIAQVVALRRLAGSDQSVGMPREQIRGDVPGGTRPMM